MPAGLAAQVHRAAKPLAKVRAFLQTVHMSVPQATVLKERLRWVFTFALGVAAALAVIVGVSLGNPDAGNFAVWATVFGFVLLLVLVFGVISTRIGRVEREVHEQTVRSKTTGIILAEVMEQRNAAQAALKEEMLFLQLNPGPMLRFDTSGRILRWNQAAISELGRGLVEDAHIRGLLPKLTDADIAICLAGEDLRPREAKVGERWWTCRLLGTPDRTGGLVFAAEVTQQKRAEQEALYIEARTRAILDGAADAIVIVVVGGIVQAVNPATQKLFGWDGDEIVGRNVEEMLPDLFAGRDGDRLSILAEYARKRITGPVERTVWGTRRSGEKFPISLTVSVYEWNGYPRASCIIRDVSDRLRAIELQVRQAQKLREQNTELESLVAELDEFNYVASHDLQEPLRTMSTYCGLLKTDLGTDLPKRADEDIKAILDASLRMQRLITDLLEYSRSGHTELRPTHVDLAKVVKRVESDLKARMQETGGRIEHSNLPWVWGDDMQLGRVLQNLIANGLKFRRSGETPIVTVTANADSEWVSVVVQDNGIGIESQYQLQIFQPFKRLHGVGKYEGSGIGLSVCRKIVERHGGRIEVESTPGVGSRFIVKLPARVPDNATSKVSA